MSASGGDRIHGQCSSRYRRRRLIVLRHKSGIYSIDGKDLREAELIDYYVDRRASPPHQKHRGSVPGRGFHGVLCPAQRAPRDADRRGRPGRDERPERIKRGHREQSMSALLLKVNQIGTVSEALDAVRMCRENRLRHSRQPPLRRDRGLLHRRFRCRHKRRPDKDGRSRAGRAHGQIQPAPADRGAPCRWPPQGLSQSRLQGLKTYPYILYPSI